jgi:hypothetical protein
MRMLKMTKNNCIWPCHVAALWTSGYTTIFTKGRGFLNDAEHHRCGRRLHLARSCKNYNGGKILCELPALPLPVPKDY